MSEDVDGRIGEAWSGEVPNGSHLNVVVGRRGSPTAAAIVGVLGSPRPGHAPFLACLSPGVVVRPMTVVVNKSPITGEGRLGAMTWGAAQLGIAQGVLDAVADGLIAASEANELVVLAALWVDPDAGDETAVKAANRAAMRAALGDALRPPPDADLRALVERREAAANGYYTGG
jgi:5,6,7,8-tetrahydromethanopterin hydro-lyase